MPDRDPAKAILVLDMLEEFYGDGLRWVRGKSSDRQHRLCLTAALSRVRGAHKLSGDGTAYYLREALPASHTLFTLRAFNDICMTYQPILDLIDCARNIARAELNGTARPTRTQPPRVTVRPIPDIWS